MSIVHPCKVLHQYLRTDARLWKGRIFLALSPSNSHDLFANSRGQKRLQNSDADRTFDIIVFFKVESGGLLSSFQINSAQFRARFRQSSRPNYIVTFLQFGSAEDFASLNL